MLRRVFALSARSVTVSGSTPSSPLEPLLARWPTLYEGTAGSRPVLGKGVFMKKTGFAVLVLVAGSSFLATQTSAQGPAGAGATAAASHRAATRERCARRWNGRFHGLLYVQKSERLRGGTSRQPQRQSRFQLHTG